MGSQRAGLSFIFSMDKRFEVVAAAGAFLTAVLQGYGSVNIIFLAVFSCKAPKQLDYLEKESQKEQVLNLTEQIA